MRAKLLVATLILLLVLAACGDDDDDDPGASTSTTAASTTTSGDGGATTTTGADDPVVGDASVEDKTSPDFPGENEVALLTDVRVASHDGFDRIVFEFDGDFSERPAFKVGYVDPPVTEDGSGEPVEIDGSAFLEIVMSAASGVDLSTDAPRPTYTGPERIDGPGSPVVELVRTGDFEAVLSWAAGVDGERPFGVQVIANPTRVVVDVATG